MGYLLMCCDVVIYVGKGNKVDELLIGLQSV